MTEEFTSDVLAMLHLHRNTLWEVSMNTPARFYKMKTNFNDEGCNPYSEMWCLRLMLSIIFADLAWLLFVDNVLIC